jgi:hypothetical protein
MSSPQRQGLQGAHRDADTGGTHDGAPHRIGPRLEAKFPLSADEAEALLGWVAARFEPEPHAKDPADPVQRVVSLYLDDARRSGYAGRETSKLPKHRVRRYDGDSPFFLEEKLRLEERVWKRRVAVDESELPATLHGTEPLSGGSEWFRARCRTLRLFPTLLVGYERRAFEAGCGARVTIDRDLTAARVDAGAASLVAVAETRAPIAGTVVEVKGPLDASPLMEAVLQRIGREAGAFSKYSRGLVAVGLEPARPSGAGDER